MITRPTKRSPSTDYQTIINIPTLSHSTLFYSSHFGFTHQSENGLLKPNPTELQMVLSKLEHGPLTGNSGQWSFLNHCLGGANVWRKAVSYKTHGVAGQPNDVEPFIKSNQIRQPAKWCWTFHRIIILHLSLSCFHIYKWGHKKQRRCEYAQKPTMSKSIEWCRCHMPICIPWGTLLVVEIVAPSRLLVELPWSPHELKHVRATGLVLNYHRAHVHHFTTTM